MSSNNGSDATISSDATNNSEELDVSIIFDLRDDDKNSTYKFHGYPTVVPLAIIMVLIIVLAIVGNIMVILTILRHRGMRTRTNMFIVNLAVADILVAALDMPVSLITIIEGDWVFGKVMCQLNGFTMALFLICSIHTLMYISVHKFISITRPFSRAMTPRRIKIMILAAWLWSVFCATGPLVGFNQLKYKKGASQCGPDFPDGFKARAHSFLITTSNYAIPLTVMIFCYARIFREIHIHMKRIRQTSNIDLENSVQQQKKVATTLFLVLACFVACWTPFVLYSNAIVLSKDRSKIPSILNPLAYWCGYLNSACNPIIYAFRSPSFRKGYKEIMCGASAPGLSAVNSLSFRSRSARGSQKSNSNVNIGNSVKIDDSRKAVRRQRTMLSQTSWRSLPLIPSLIRSFSTKNGGRKDEPDSPVTTSGCGMCGLWRPRPSSYHAGGTDDQVSPDIPEGNNVHSLNDIKEDNAEDGRDYDDIRNSDDDGECGEIHDNNKGIKDREESV